MALSQALRAQSEYLLQAQHESLSQLREIIARSQHARGTRELEREKDGAETVATRRAKQKSTAWSR
jgi:hypothetical protein